MRFKGSNQAVKYLCAVRCTDTSIMAQVIIMQSCVPSFRAACPSALPGVPSWMGYDQNGAHYGLLSGKKHNPANQVPEFR